MEGKGNHLKMILEYVSYRIKSHNITKALTYYFGRETVFLRKICF